jgi:hypothetical protein
MEKKMKTKKIIDTNGWVEIKNNPLSKVGVFPYSGKQIDDSLDKDKIYYVYRPAEELSKKECLDSFKLLPWVNEHAMLGQEEKGLLPPEMKGIQGVIGEDVSFSDPYIVGNVKIFAETLANLIKSGKKELSVGYRCDYELKSGVYDGVKYDAIQKNIRGNHLALVNEGRMGPDVRVMDYFNFALDEKSIEEAFVDKKVTGTQSQKSTENTQVFDEKSFLALSDKVAKLTDTLNNFIKVQDEKEKKEEEDEEEEESKEKEEKDNKDSKTFDSRFNAMDEKLNKLIGEISELKSNATKKVMSEISQKNDLAEKVSRFIGAFDHSTMTMDEMAKYSVKKLELQSQEGQELAVLNGFLAGKSSVINTVTLDSAQHKPGVLDNFLKTL